MEKDKAVLVYSMFDMKNILRYPNSHHEVAVLGVFSEAQGKEFRDILPCGSTEQAQKFCVFQLLSWI